MNLIFRNRRRRLRLHVHHVDGRFLRLGRRRRHFQCRQDLISYPDSSPPRPPQPSLEHAEQEQVPPEDVVVVPRCHVQDENLKSPHGLDENANFQSSTVLCT